MNDDTRTKKCVLCGTDCSHDPRLKDRRGRYVHKSCYRRLVERREKVQAQADALKERATAAGRDSAPAVVSTRTRDAVPAGWEKTGFRYCRDCGEVLSLVVAVCPHCGTSQ